MADDLGDGLRARIEELEQRIVQALALETPPRLGVHEWGELDADYRDGYADALDDLQTILRGDL